MSWCVFSFAHARNRMGVPPPMRHPSEEVALTFRITTVLLGPPKQPCQNLTLTQSLYSWAHGVLWERSAPLG